MRYFNTEGIVLRKYLFGETDQGIIIYTPSYGKIMAYAKGSRKLISKRRASLELGTICKFQIYMSTKSMTVTQTELIEDMHFLKSSLEGICALTQLMEMIDRLVHIEYPYPAHYEKVKASLEFINKTHAYCLGLIYFIIQHLTSFGLLNNVKECSRCHSLKSNGSSYLIPQEGEIICSQCHKITPHKYSHRVNVEENDMLYRLQNSSLETIQENEWDDERYTNLLKIGYILLEKHLQRPLNTVTSSSYLFMKQDFQKA